MDVIETKRLILRPFTLDDAEDLYSYGKDPRVGPIAGWQPHKSIEESREIIKNVFSSDNIAAIEFKGNGRALGSVGFVDNHPLGAEPDCRDDELGYGMHPDYWGRGIMTEAAEALVRWGFEKRGFDRIWCGYYEGNDRSRRVMEKCGFKFAFSRMEFVEDMNETRKTYFYLLSREDWRERVSCAADRGGK